MKTLFSALLILILTPAAFATNVATNVATDVPSLKPAQTCGFVEDLVELEERVGTEMEEYIEITPYTKFDWRLAQRIRKMVEHVNGETNVDFWAARRLIILSQGYMQAFEMGGEKYLMIAFYPGGNERGMIFKGNDVNGVAVIANGRIACK